MGPVRLILLPSSVHPSEVIRQENPEQPMAQYADKPWLSLTSDQLDHLSEAKRERVARQLIEYCQQHFPLHLQGLDDVEQQQWAIGCQRSADRHGYGAVDEVMRWVNLYAVLGDDFPDAPDNVVFRQILGEKGVLPEQRLNKLNAELPRQLLAEKELFA